MGVPKRSPTQQTVGHSGMQGSREAMQEGYNLDETHILVPYRRLNPGARARSTTCKATMCEATVQPEVTSPEGVARANRGPSAGAGGRDGRRGPTPLIRLPQ
jgi:hypothetical protein